jgi:aspartyl-tRNA(Asn)/glutamyl-tRNA(Gln) amidotransferase subunit C
MTGTPSEAGMSAAARTLSADDVRHVAKLARLTLTDEEVDRFTAQLAGVLAHAADVAALDLAEVPPTAHALEMRNVLRPDEPVPSLDREEVLAAAPDVEDFRFRVPRIVGDVP